MDGRGECNATDEKVLKATMRVKGSDYQRHGPCRIALFERSVEFEELRKRKAREYFLVQVSFADIRAVSKIEGKNRKCI